MNSHAHDTTSAPTHIDVLDPSAPVLFRHVKREQWGLGVVSSKLDDRVRLQFQDGQERTFLHGYYHMLDVADRPLDVTRRILDALASMSDEGRKKTTGTGERPISMDEQIVYFRELFEGGFQDDAYATHHRGDGRKRPLKRHRDALVAGAAALEKRALAQRIGAMDFAGVHAAAVELVSATDLVTVAERKRFADIGPEHHEAFAITLRALLHGTSGLPGRFDAFVRMLEAAMGHTPTWALATLLPGCVHHGRAVVVREKVLALQAVWMAPGLALSERPMGLLYERLVEMAEGVRANLEDAGLEPRDMLDVTDFMWETLRPKAQARILEMRRERGLDGELEVARGAAKERAADSKAA